MPQNIINVIMDMNIDTKTRIRVEGDLIEEINTTAGVRQGDSLSPIIFNLIKDQIIDKIKPLSGFRKQKY